MDRRNFFLLAGATTVALSADAGAAETATKSAGAYERERGLKDLTQAAGTFAGTPLDTQIVEIGRQAAKIRGGRGGAAMDEIDIVCGPWYFYIHWVMQKGNVIDPVKEFGRDFATLPLSKMIDTVARSKFGGNNMSITFNRDGELQVSH